MLKRSSERTGVTPNTTSTTPNTTTTVPTTTVPTVADKQEEWFGRPLRGLFGAVTDLCGLTQAQLAEYLGISAPMVSQLMTGRREKPGNPLVQERIVALGAALDEFDASRIDAAGVQEVLDAMAAPPPVTPARSSVMRSATSAADPMTQAQFVRNLLATVASADELDGAAKLVEKRYPEVAELIRVYGTGRTSDAVAHLQAHGLV